MSNCPYKNFKKKIKDYLGVLQTPRAEYSGFAPCPFVAKEINQDNLMIEIFDPKKNSIIEMVKTLKESKYESALFVQKSGEEIPAASTYEYQTLINNLLKESDYKEYACICLNPKDTVNIEGFSIRQASPYFLINIVDRKTINIAHNKMLKTKYFDKMNKEYLDFLHVKEEQIGRKKWKKKN
jgi:hypothetical protein